MKIKPHLVRRFSAHLCAGLLLVSACHSALAGNTWTGGGASNNWSDNNNWGGATPAYGTLTFTTGGAQGTTSNNNSITSMNELNWTGSLAWTLNGSSTISLFDNGGTQAKVENDSTGLVTINDPITYAATAGATFAELNAVNGGLTFGSSETLTVNGSQVAGIKLFGSGQIINFNNTVNATGKYFGFTTSGTGNTVNIGGSFTSGDWYVMNGGTLNIASGGSLTTTAVRLGGDFGTTGNQVQTAAGSFQLTSATGGQTFGSTINSVTGNTSNNLQVNSLNTSGTNNITGGIFLDSQLKISQSTGGTLNLNAVDVKAQLLLLLGGGNINLTGVVQNSTGTPTNSLQIGSSGVAGGPVVTISNTDTYTGDTLVRAGTLQFATGGTINSSTIRLGSATGTSVDAAMNLTNATGGETIGSVINPVTTSGTGNITINSQNTSGVNTLTNHLALDRNLTITQAAGGELDYTQAHTDGATAKTGNDIKGFTETFTPAANGLINVSGDIYNSTGTGGLILNGAGTLELSGGVNSTFAGGVSVISGTLAVGSDTGAGTGGISLGGTSANTPTLIALNGSRSISNNVTLLATSGGGNPTIAGSNSLTLNGTLTNSGANRTLTVNNSATTTQVGSVFLSEATGTGRTLTINGSGNTSITGAIANFNGSGTAGSLTYSGTGALTLSGPNTYSGTTTLSSGTLNINSPTALGTSAFALNGGTIDNSTAGAITLTNNDAVTWGGSFAFTGTKDLNFGIGAVSNNAPRTIALNGSGSTLTFGGTLSETNSNTITVNGAGNTLSLGGLALSATSTARTQTFAGTSNVNVTGAITNGSATSGDLAFTGTGTMVLSGPNTYSDSGAGVTTIGTTAANAGILRLSGAGTLGATSNALTIRGGTLDLNGTTQTIGTLLLGGGTATTPNITLGGGTLNLGGTVTYSATNNPNASTISGAGAVNLNGTQIFNIGDSTNTTSELTISSVIANGSSTSGLTKQGAGTMALTGTASNTYTGLTTVTGGELDLNKTGAQAMGGNLTIGGGTVVWDQNNQLATSSFVTINSGTLNLNGQTQTVMDLKNLGGTFMTGAGSWTGTSNSMTWGASSVANTINTGGSVTDIHITVAGGSNTIQNGGVLNVSPAGTGLEMDGGTITLNADPTSPGKISLMSNVVADDGTTSSINTSSATNAGVIDLNGATRTFTVGSSNAATTLNVSANIVGTNGGVTSAGPGSLVLTGNNTYTGATTVSAGTLNAGATGALGSTSNVTVGSSGTLLLSGSGNLNRVNDAAGISLGGGTFARTGTASEGTGATIVNGSATGGSNTTGLGALTLTATSNLDFGSSGVGTLVFASFTPSGNILNILNYTNTNANFALNNSGVDGTDDRLIFATDQSGNLGDFNFGGGITAEEIALGGGYFEITGISAVPEPGTWVAAGLALATLLYSQRRRFVRHR